MTIAELSKALLSDQRFGLYIRGLADDGTVYDEPEAHHDPALTIRLTVDATMEPVWELICDRYPTPRVLSNRDRSLFGVVRLAGEEARHLGDQRVFPLLAMLGIFPSCAMRFDVLQCERLEGHRAREFLLCLAFLS